MKVNVYEGEKVGYYEFVAPDDERVQIWLPSPKDVDCPMCVAIILRKRTDKGEPLFEDFTRKEGEDTWFPDAVLWWRQDDPIGRLALGELFVHDVPEFLTQLHACLEDMWDDVHNEATVESFRRAVRKHFDPRPDLLAEVKA